MNWVGDGSGRGFYPDRLRIPMKMLNISNPRTENRTQIFPITKRDVYLIP